MVPRLGKIRGVLKIMNAFKMYVCVTLAAAKGLTKLNRFSK